MDKGIIISQALKEGKWLDVEYQHTENELTYFWAAIYDIDPKSKKLMVKIFNDRKSYDCLDAKISYEKIVGVKPISFSDYSVPYNLIDKIEKNLDEFQWLKYDRFNQNVLKYLNECNFLDNDPFQKEHVLVPGIDLHVLHDKKELILSQEQTDIILKKIYRYDIKNTQNANYDLCVSALSIDIGSKKYLVSYYQVCYDPSKKSLRIKDELRFNKSFLIDGRKHSLFNYLNMDVEDFIKGFEDDRRVYTELLRSNLKPGEILNEQPEMFLLEREYTVDLSSTFEVIEEKYHEGKLEVPMKSFFGNISKKNNIRTKEPTIVIYNEQININQMRVIYNSMKYPVTYVQGPPGTGKTQTILNVILSAFFDEKTVLVCSANNKPVDGIIEKINFKYRGETVLFPYLRLGKISDVIEATEKIKKLFEFKTDRVVKEHLINKIKKNSDIANAELIKLLDIQEQKIRIEDYIDSSKRLLDELKNSNSSVANNLRNRIVELEKELAKLPAIDNKDVLRLFNPIVSKNRSNEELLQFLYYKSIYYVNKLKEPKYTELIDICYIEDECERATSFNKWLQHDHNMKLLNNAFPIIFSTNISSNRLGTPNFLFDLVVMDEAGQCNVAHALIPISKAKSLLLVGDPNQLKPVVVLEDSVNMKLMEKYKVDKNYNYREFSILEVMINNDNISKYILLKYHYRCGKKIINFSNARYYKSTLDLSYIKQEGELEYIPVKNANVYEKNAPYDEALEIIKYIKRNDIHDVSIVTPFVNQQILINKLLIENGLDDIHCGTIHSLQGAEKDTIILSTALSAKTSKETFKWLKNNFELINVGITRAKNKLVICSDKDALEVLSQKDDDLYNLVKYAMENGNIAVPPNETIKVEIGKSNSSKNEDEFFKTISHFCSVNSFFEAKRNVKLKKLFPDDDRYKNSELEFDLVIYRKIYSTIVPEIIIEVNGGEHFKNRKREYNDTKKILFTQDKKIRFITIDNTFVKSYEYIRDLIIASKDKKTTQISLFDFEDF